MRRAVVALGTVAVLALGVAAHALGPADQGDVVTETGGPGPGVDPATVAALTVDGMPPLACGFAPIDVLAAEPGVENADTAEARGLRAVIAQTQGSMSPQGSHDWVEMWRRGTTIEYGRRAGAIGIDQVLGIERQGDGYTFGGSSGCGPVGYRDGRGAQQTTVYVERDGQLEVRYDGGSCDTRPWEARVQETDRYVDVLLLSPVPHPDPDECLGVGMDRTARTNLSRPVGGRVVRNIGYLPVEVMLSQAADDARREDDEAAWAEAEALCARAGRELSRSVDIAYVSDVASVRAAVHATREPWRDLPDDALAGDCYLADPDGSRMAVVVAEGVAPVIRTAHHTDNLADRIPEVGGRRYR